MANFKLRHYHILIVVDYRLRLEDTGTLMFMCKAAEFLRRRLKLHGILVGSSLSMVDSVLPQAKFKKVSVPSEIVTNFDFDARHVESNAAARKLVFTTIADSDFEFNLGERLWE